MNCHRRCSLNPEVSLWTITYAWALRWAKLKRMQALFVLVCKLFFLLWKWLLISSLLCSEKNKTNLSEFLHLFMCIWVELLRYVLHPKQRSTVLSPWLLHSIHCQPRVWDGTITERFHLLVQTAQRVPQSQSAGCRIKLRIKVLHVAWIIMWKICHVLSTLQISLLIYSAALKSISAPGRKALNDLGNANGELKNQKISNGEKKNRNTGKTKIVNMTFMLPLILQNLNNIIY